MNIPAIVIDIDNTIIDTALRKFSIITQHFNKIKIDLSDIREDYFMTSFLSYEQMIDVVDVLESSEGIRKFQAPAFEFCVEVINNWIREGIRLILITARPDSIKNETIEEIRNLGINPENINIHLTTEQNRNIENVISYKKTIIEEYINNYDILCVIGDRVEDMKAGRELGLSTILFNSTNLKYNCCDGDEHYICKNWREVNKAVNIIKIRSSELKKMRDNFSQQYALWMTDVDGKANNSAVIGLGLATIAGAILTNGEFVVDCEIPFLIISLTASILAVIFSILSITPRRTSGNKAGTKITTYNIFGILRNLGYIIYLIFGIQRFKYMGNSDPVKAYDLLKNESLQKQKIAHVNFLKETLKSTDPEAMKNMRLFSLRAAQYSKIHSHKISSFFLIISVLAMVGWAIIKFIYL